MLVGWGVSLLCFSGRRGAPLARGHPALPGFVGWGYLFNGACHWGGGVQKCDIDVFFL